MEPLRVVDTHTGGEPTRIVVGGAPDLGTGSMAERLEILRTEHDWLRTSVIDEPRGSEVIVGALLCDSVDPACDAGVIFFNNAGYLNMCGHGTIGLAVALRHLGRAEKGQRLRLETPVGVVEARLGEAGEVSIRNVPSFLHRRDVQIRVRDHGTVTGDVAWGGNWFFLVDTHGLTLEFDRIPELTEFCLSVREGLEVGNVTGDDGGEIDHIELISDCPEIPEADSRSFVLCPGGAYDRSPCGTGTSAKLACLHARGRLAEGEVWTQASIIGSLFRASFKVDGETVVPEISGQAWVSGESSFLFDVADPYRFGIHRGSVR